MSDTMHPLAPHHLPGFITAPGETDVLLTGSAVFLVVMVLFLGSMYFWLHSIPERIAHGTSKLQFQLVAVLALLALFTHNNAFWVAALLLALVPIPDFWTPLATMAESLAKMARRGLGGATERPAASAPDVMAPTSTPLPHELVVIPPKPPEIPTGTHQAESLAAVPASAPVLQASDQSAPSAKAGSKRHPAPSTEGA